MSIQMDIKIHGLTRPIVEEAIRRTKEAREYILTEVMEKCIAEPRNNVNKYAPKIIQIQIDLRRSVMWLVREERLSMLLSSVQVYRSISAMKAQYLSAA